MLKQTKLMKIFTFHIDDYESSADYQFTHSDPSKTGEQFEKDIKNCLKVSGEKYLKNCILKNEQVSGNCWIEFLDKELEILGYVPLVIKQNVGLFEPRLTFCAQYSRGNKKLDKKDTHVNQLIATIGEDLAQKMYNQDIKIERELHERHKR